MLDKQLQHTLALGFVPHVEVQEVLDVALATVVPDVSTVPEISENAHAQNPGASVQYGTEKCFQCVTQLLTNAAAAARQYMLDMLSACALAHALSHAAT